MGALSALTTGNASRGGGSLGFSGLRRSGVECFSGFALTTLATRTIDII